MAAKIGKRSSKLAAKAAARRAAYPALLGEIKTRIRSAQARAVAAVNAELVSLYWEIGKLISDRQAAERWGSGVLRRLAADLRNDLADVKGFSERNLKLMTQFYREYPAPGSIGQPAVAQLRGGPASIGQPAVAQLLEGQGSIGQPAVAQLREGQGSIGQPPVAQLPWAHHVLLMQRIKDRAARQWYAQKTMEQGWSRNVLAVMIESKAHKRQGKALTNFALRLPPPQSDLAQEALKDPYHFDFLTLEEPFHEKELEAGLLRHVEKFLLELGGGFAFVGRQARFEAGGEEFYIDLLFYHYALHCFVVIDLKAGAFKAEYAGKMNFYCNLVDDRLRQDGDNPTLGLVLCQNRNKVVAEYSLRGIAKAIGVSEYRISRALPRQLRSFLPSVEQIERELADTGAKPEKPKPKKRAAKRRRSGA